MNYNGIFFGVLICGFLFGFVLCAGILEVTGYSYYDGHKDGWIDNEIGKVCYVTQTNEDRTVEWVKADND